MHPDQVDDTIVDKVAWALGMSEAVELDDDQRRVRRIRGEFNKEEAIERVNSKSVYVELFDKGATKIEDVSVYFEEQVMTLRLHSNFVALA